MDLEKILKVAVRGGASDIMLKTNSVPRFRLNGELMNLSDGDLVTPEIMQAWVEKILPSHLAKRLQKAGDVDFAYESKIGSRFRVNLFRQRQTYGMVLRVIQNHIKTLEELHLPAIVSEFSEFRRGLVLVTGATGSGKSTTLAAILDRINRTQAGHIITIEDPIEFNFKDELSTINQREIGIDTDSFSGALRAALRQDPDVILVGELRDRETTETALMAAETGHLVLSTLHTSDAVESLTRLLSYFPPHQHQSIRMMLAHSLRSVISQRLVSRIDGRGRVAAVEILVCNASVRDIINNNDSFVGMRQIIRSGQDTYGMQSFDQSLLELFQTGAISKDEALSQASHQDDMLLALQGFGT